MHWKPTILVSNGDMDAMKTVFLVHTWSGRPAWWFRVLFYWVVVIIIATHNKPRWSHNSLMESHWHGAPCCNRCFPYRHMSCDHNNLMESHWHGALLQKVLSILAYELWSQQPNGEPLTWGDLVATSAFPIGIWVVITTT
jgi:hypothetical protein